MHYYSFRDRFKKNNITDYLKDRSYKLLSFDFYNPMPLKAFGATFYIQKHILLKKALNIVQNYQKQHGQIDVIHIQSVCHNFKPLIAFELSKKLNIPYLVTEHFSKFSSTSDNIFSPFTSLSEIKKIVQSASYRFGVSKSASENYSHFFNCEFKVMYNLVSSLFVSQPTLVKQAEGNCFKLLSIGRFDENKGQLFLIKAFSKLVAMNPNFKLTFIGAGVDRGKMIQLINDLGLTNKVFILNSMSKHELIKMIDQSDVIVSSSKKETFGLTIVEAFFRGKPVISTRSGGPDELINDTNGVLVNCDDENDMVNKILFMHENYKKFDSQVIKNNAINVFSEEAISSKMKEFYELTVTNHIKSSSKL